VIYFIFHRSDVKYGSFLATERDMKYGAEAYKVSLSRNENRKNRRRARCKERRAGKAAVKEQLG
jgi:hypothetical protein